MKVLHLLPTLEVGGAERFVERLAPVLAARHGVEQQVMGLVGDGPVGIALRDAGITAGALSSPGVVGTFKAVAKARSLVATFRPDIVQTWLYMADLAGVVATMRRGGPRLVWNLRCSDIWLNPATRTLRRACAVVARHAPDAIIACGDRTAAFHRTLGYPADAMSVIPNGYRFAPRVDALAALMDHHADGHDARILIGAAGRYDQAKGYPYLLEAIALLRDRGLDVGLVMAGRGCVPANAALTAEIERLDLGGRVELLGELDDLGDFYARLDLFCLSSISEGFPNVLCEALAAGVPAVSTDAGDAAQIMGAGEVVPIRSAVALADGMTQLLAMPRSAMIAAASATARRVRENYDLDRVADRYHLLYTSLLTRPRPAQN